MKEFINGDCMEGMREYPDNFFDLAIVDPQYGIGESGKNNKSRSNPMKGSTRVIKSKDYGNKKWDDKPPPIEYFIELNRVSKHQIIWGANHFGNMPPSPSWIVWDKDNGNNDFADCELAYTSFKTAVRKFTFRWHGMLQQDMKNKEERIHPTQKPVQLYKWLLRNYAQPDFKLLSTHVGSASDLIAFEDFGCEYVGYEIDPDYYADALKRLNYHKAQLTLKYND